jgi:hypothetical protein
MPELSSPSEEKHPSSFFTHVPISYWRLRLEPLVLVEVGKVLKALSSALFLINTSTMGSGSGPTEVEGSSNNPLELEPVICHIVHSVVCLASLIKILKNK